MQDFLFYLKIGWEHIISADALDHQLFILALVTAFSFRDLKKILILVTAFTIGHSITLALSVLDIFRLPSNLVEFLIPVTILITAADNLLLRKNDKILKINYFLALFFGLIHGMGFANSARLMIAKEQTIAIPLLGFNIGLELGQIIVVLIVIALFYLLEKVFKLNEKYRIIAISIIVIIFSLKMIFERFGGIS